MIDILVFFIGASLLLYVVLGGSDFGAGILELLPAGRLRGKQKDVINHAMGPVWEANHMWLILIVVILFMGFPVIFTTLMVALHLPMLALLVGIVVRGTAFTFRHYDAIQEKKSQRTYTWLFGLSSLWTAFWLGIIAASLNRGTIDPDATEFWRAYIAPWWGAYPLSVGAFVACIYAFLASIYLIGETDDVELKRRFHRFGAYFNGLVILMGGVVFAASLGEHESLATAFLRSPLNLAVVALATGLFVALWFFVTKHRVMLTRVVASGQVALILIGWCLLYAPNAVLTTRGPLSFYTEAAPLATLRQLVIALLVGSVFIFPSLFFLLRVFKLSGSRDATDEHAENSRD
ncbi:cytochrome BD ubiquinol oxidase subunit II [Nibricoccus aquaticus]|uniref:Cytochrome BD ubiquinol oxidase subunit II n=1 Tax=Nibricoccus aquaticus TaxID=2576891 RepID=A0A290QA64_9BACT|nr:cytochrome d ubiquinol oxidase subunit II [Nibricoccus aquaticus]ATC65147.1 cytochrome BD ubiquinol oxidase subunit II [Nibricoccus aquaticus]